MATFSLASYVISFRNHSNTEINYDIRKIINDPKNSGNVAPGATAQLFPFNPDGTLEFGNIAVVGIGQLGQPQLAPAPGVRFWSGYEPKILGKAQYINLLAENGWNVTKNTSLLSEVTGHGFRVTVDAGGSDPNTTNIWFQVYNA